MPVSDLALDPVTGDLLIEGGRTRLAYGAEAVRQQWASRLTMFRGECFLDPELGIDYPGEVLIKGARLSVLRAIFSDATRATPGVADIVRMDLAVNPGTRELTIRATVTLDTGETTDLTLSETVGG